MKAQAIEVERRPFLSDITEFRRRVREHLDQGAAANGYNADRDAVIRVLNDVVATKIVCVLRYKRHYNMASGNHAQSVAQEFLEHATDEQGHADLTAARIVQLGGAPDLNPAGLATRSSRSQHMEGASLVDMIREDLVAERIAVETYGEIIRYFGEDDPTTRTMIETIKAKEEEHAEDLNALFKAIEKQ